jgi:CubicO group peptidase (beta-lactamase class C family)
MNIRHWTVTVAALALGGAAQGQATYDFSGVTTLVQGALAGQNVNSPVPGVDVLLMHRGKVVYRRAFGDMTLDEVVAADSATKTVSGALIMSVVDQSTQPFTLDTRLSQFIPQFSGAKSTITIRQCFSHTSGMFGQSLALSDSTITLQQAAVRIANAPQAAAPGSEFAYGGVSMHAAGAVAELASGLPWNTLFQQRLATPLGMASTRYVLTSPANPRVAGGCESNAPDFGRFMEMLRRGGLHAGPLGDVRVLSQGAVDALFTRQTPVGIPIENTPLPGVSDYGVGVWLDRRHPDGRLESAVAAGARGFTSWVDFDDELVGVFATDRTSSGNVQNVVYLIRDAAQAAVRAAVWCPADFNRSHAATIDDVFIYLNAWFAGDPATDRNADGVDIDDIFLFLNAWFAGC